MKIGYEDEMTDAKKCRMIAEFEGLAVVGSGPPERLEYVDNGRHPLPDYPHDLNATMRAARKLDRLALIVDSTGNAFIQNDMAERGCLQFYPTDSARAAFEALAAYLTTDPR